MLNQYKIYNEKMKMLGEERKTYIKFMKKFKI